MKDLPLAKVYQLLEPGPVVLLTTARKGRANVMTMSLKDENGEEVRLKEGAKVRVTIEALPQATTPKHS